MCWLKKAAATSLPLCGCGGAATGGPASALEQAVDAGVVVNTVADVGERKEGGGRPDDLRLASRWTVLLLTTTPASASASRIASSE